MSTSSERSIGEELVRIIRAEIAAYDGRKDDAMRARQVADEAVAKADQAAKDVRDSVSRSPLREMFGDVNAQAIDALFRRQQRSHVDFTVNQRDRGVVFRDPVATDRAQRQQAETAAATASAVNAELAKKTTAPTSISTGEYSSPKWWRRRRKG